MIIPARNEAENLPICIAEIYKALDSENIDHEILVINDGSNDDTIEQLDLLSSRFQTIRCIENKKEHIWHMEFDDINYELIISKKIQYIDPILTVSSIKKLSEIFKQSLVLELYWENQIKYKKNIENKITQKFSRLSLLKSFISKNLRTFLKRK